MSPDDYCVIETVLWFSKTDELADAENNLEHLDLYDWDGQFF